jgi:hypothetical protein
MRSPLALVPLLALLLPAAASAGVVVNELFPDAPSTDEGNEWIELFNAGTSAEDLSGWTIERATTGSYSVRYTVPSGTTLAAGDWLVIGEELVAGADLSLGTGVTLDMGNASANADVVRIKDASGNVVDTVVYGTPNSEGHLDDTGAAATSTAPMSSGKAIARDTDGIDTNDCGADFSTATTPTPGAANLTGGGDTDTGEPPTDCVPAQVVKINELLPDPDVDSNDSGDEWLELYNPGSAEIDVSGYKLTDGTATGWDTLLALPAGTFVPAGGYLLIGNSMVGGADVVSDALKLGNASSKADGVRLEDCYGAVIDTVVYGVDNTDLLVDDSGAVATSMAPKPRAGEPLARLTDGADTDQCAVDFESADYGTPGFGNDTPPDDCGAPTSGLKINELLPDPEGADGESGLGWVELYNAGDATLDLSGWEVQSATGNDTGDYSWSTEAAFEPGVTLAPGDWLLVGAINVVGADVVAENLDLPNGDHGDGVRIVDCAGFVADTVVYGSDNLDLLVDDSGSTATSLASDPPENTSLQRVSDGQDTDQSGVDFALQESPTPGVTNPVIEVDPCVPSQGTVVINELMSNPDGTDDGLEWFELYNRSDVAVSLSGWWLAAATQPDGLATHEVDFGAGTSIPPKGFFVVGGEQTDFSDLVKTFSLPNGSTGDALRLYDCEGNAVDTVVYGDDNADGMPDDEGSVPADAYVDPDENQVAARVEDGVDNDAADDWFVDPTPTPGATNYQEPIVDTGDDTPGGKGCNKRDDEGDAPSGGCGSRPDGSISGLLLLGLLWRRRRP